MMPFRLKLKNIWDEFTGTDEDIRTPNYHQEGEFLIGMWFFEGPWPLYSRGEAISYGSAQKLKNGLYKVNSETLVKKPHEMFFTKLSNSRPGNEYKSGVTKEEAEKILRGCMQTWEKLGMKQVSRQLLLG